MILVDLNQIMMTSMHASFSRDLANGTFDDGLIRHLILNMIRANNVRFRNKYGRIVICCDSKQSWRKKVFQHYKAHRKAARKQQTHIDWAAVFELFSKVKQELIEYTDYPVIEIEGAEGDDVIAVLAIRHANEPNIIISADKDFVQLQAHTKVVQYDPINDRYLKSDDPVRFLEEHILEGDRGDGVPNVLSDGDTFVTPGKRQGTMTKKRLEEMLSTSVANWTNETHKSNWKRNQMLIDLRSIPSSIVLNIANEFDAQRGRNSKRLFEYFTKYGLVNLISCIDEF